MATSTPTFADPVPVVFLELASQSFIDARVGKLPVSTPSQPEAQAASHHPQACALANARAEIDPHLILEDPHLEVSITVIRATTTIGRLPAIVQFHDDGWLIGTLGTCKQLMPTVRAGTSAAVVSAAPTPPPGTTAVPPEIPMTEALIAEGMKASTTVAPPNGISPREREVLALVAQGQSNKEIAEVLFVAPSTIKTHVTSLLTKLDACSRAHLVNIAAQRGLLLD